MSADKKSLKLYIEEQRRYHDELTAANITIRNKITTYIGVILALLTFLYSGALDKTKPTLERLFIPPELYGKIFYFFGLFFVFYSISRLVHASRPNGTWSVAVDSKDTELIESIHEEEYLVKLKNDYELARSENVVQYDKRFIAFKDSFYPLLLGAIILIVLRYFQ